MKEEMWHILYFNMMRKSDDESDTNQFEETQLCFQSEAYFSISQKF